MSDNCVYCSKPCGWRQQSLQCDFCDRWQHRTCQTGISQAFYRDLTKGNVRLEDWRCYTCSLTRHISTSATSASTATAILEEFNPRSPTPPPRSPTPPPRSPTPPPRSPLIFQRPNPLDESAIQPRALPELEVNHVMPAREYTVVEDGSKRGKSKLVDNFGYSYVANGGYKESVYWRCSVRGKERRCPASVVQKGDSFLLKNTHNHEGIPGTDIITKVAAKVKAKCTSQLFTSAQQIVEEEYQNLEAVPTTLPSLVAMAKRGNTARQNLRPPEFDSLEYDLRPHYVPDDFLVDDLTVEGARHLVFATTEQLETMKMAKTWYMDGTFGIVRKPFVQLYSVHVFLVSETGDMKQVPVCYMFMSRKRKVDYEAVFKAVFDRCDGIRVQRVMADFEAGAWEAMRYLRPEAELRGCAFHWQQAVYRRIQMLGLETEYCRNSEFYSLVKKLMALPYLSPNHIMPEFEKLKDLAGPTATPLFNYAENQWLTNNLWPIHTWSVYRLTVRTNNDCEGWHKRINSRAGKRNVNFFLLVSLLHKEAGFLPTVKEFVQHGQMKRLQNTRTKAFNRKLEGVWAAYEDESKTIPQTLAAISSLLKK